MTCLHRILFLSTNSANGRLQNTSVTGPENRQRRVWVDFGLSLISKADVRQIIG